MNELKKSAVRLQASLRRHIPTFKLIWVLVLVLVLLIPLGMIQNVLNERMVRRQQAVSEITSSWGEEQVVVGPVLAIPYLYKTEAERDQWVDGRLQRLTVEQNQKGTAFILPEDLTIAGEITPSRLHRGIYEAVVYGARLNISGHFAAPDFDALGIDQSNIQWQEAFVTMAISDLRGTGEVLKLTLGETPLTLMPGCRLSGYASGVSARIPDLKNLADAKPFNLDLTLKGSRGLSFAPVGRQTRVNLTSPWTAPSFRGAFLPAQRTTGEKGFDASWLVSWYGRSYPQVTTVGPGAPHPLDAATIAPSLFGVDFIVPVDSYRMIERATKYGILFIALIFTAFFLFELLAALHIHTIQYTLIGAALCLFYLAVLSLSEFIAFGLAYAVGAAASTLLIVLYSHSLLDSGRRTLFIAGALGLIYGYLYIVLQLQDFSLLFGTAGLFLVLAILMAATRNLNRLTGRVLLDAPPEPS